MSEATTILTPPAASAAGAPPAAAVPPAASPAAAATPPAAAVPGAGDQGGSDWRALLAGEDDKAKQMLERYADPGAFMKTFTEAQNTIRSKMEGAIKIPGDNATDEDRAAFAKALGIPEAPDKYERVEPPKGLDLGEGDRAFIDAKLADLHKKGGFTAHPEVAKTFQALYYDALNERAAQMAATAVVKAQEAERQLQKEWGADYKMNLGLANEALRSLGGDEAVALLDQQFMDGTTLGAHPAIIKMLANAARATSEDLTFTKSLVSAPAMGVEALQAEYDKMRAWRNGSATERARYADASKPGGDLEKVMAQLERASGRRA